MDRDLATRIAVDAGVCGGMSRVQGTRIPIAVILDGLAEGLTPDQLLDHFPQLTIVEVRATLAYAAEMSRRGQGCPRSREAPP